MFLTLFLSSLTYNKDRRTKASWTSCKKVQQKRWWQMNRKRNHTVHFCNKRYCSTNEQGCQVRINGEIGGILYIFFLLYIFSLWKPQNLNTKNTKNVNKTRNRTKKKPAPANQNKTRECWTLRNLGIEGIAKECTKWITSIWMFAPVVVVMLVVVVKDL